MGVISAENTRRLARVVELCELRCRTAVIESMTSVPKSTIRKIYNEINNESPPSGQMKVNSVSLMESGPERHLSATLLAQLLIADTAAPDEYTRLTQGYRRYAALLQATGWPVVEFADAWLVHRDILNRATTLRYCRRCRLSFLYPMAGGINCPSCTLERDSAICTTCGRLKSATGRCHKCEGEARRLRRARQTHAMGDRWIAA